MGGGGGGVGYNGTKIYRNDVMMRCPGYGGRVQHVQPQKGRNNKPTRGGEINRRGNREAEMEKTGEAKKKKESADGGEIAGSVEE